jgi:hypothetical protein
MSMFASVTGMTQHLQCGRVFFTTSVEPWVDGKEPTGVEVAARLGAVITTTVLLGGVLGVGLVGGLSGITSVRGVKKDGVYADGRVMVVKGRPIGDSCAYELFIHAIENR